jgi:hypothetical protein
MYHDRDMNFLCLHTVIPSIAIRSSNFNVFGGSLIKRVASSKRLTAWATVMVLHPRQYLSGNNDTNNVRVRSSYCT